MVKRLTEKRIALTMSAEQVATVEDWRRRQPKIPSFADAVRVLMEAGAKALSGTGKDQT